MSHSLPHGCCLDRRITIVNIITKIHGDRNLDTGKGSLFVAALGCNTPDILCPAGKACCTEFVDVAVHNRVNDCQTCAVVTVAVGTKLVLDHMALKIRDLAEVGLHGMAHSIKRTRNDLLHGNGQGVSRVEEGKFRLGAPQSALDLLFLVGNDGAVVHFAAGAEYRDDRASFAPPA